MNARRAEEAVIEIEGLVKEYRGLRGGRASAVDRLFITGHTTDVH